MIVGQGLAVVAVAHEHMGMRWKVGQGWGVGTRAVPEASLHDGDRKRGVKAVGNVTLDN